MKKLHKLLVILMSLCMVTALTLVPALAAEDETVVDVENTVVEGTHPEPVVIKAAGVKFAEGAKLDGGLKVAAPVEVVVPTGVTVAALEVSVEAEGASLTVDEGATVAEVTVAAPATVEIKGQAASVTVAETAATETAKASVTVADTAKVSGAVEVKAPVVVEVKGEAGSVSVAESAATESAKASVTVADTAKVSGSVDVKAAVAVEIKGEAGSVKVAESAKGVELTVAKTATVAEMKVEAPEASIKVDGKVEAMEIAADNVAVSGAGEITNAVVTAGEGVSFEGVSGTVDNQSGNDIDRDGETLPDGESNYTGTVEVETPAASGGPSFTPGNRWMSNTAPEASVIVAPLSPPAERQQANTEKSADVANKSAESYSAAVTPLGSYSKTDSTGKTTTINVYRVSVTAYNLKQTRPSGTADGAPPEGYWVGVGIQVEATDKTYIGWVKAAPKTEGTEASAADASVKANETTLVLDAPPTSADAQEDFMEAVDDLIAGKGTAIEDGTGHSKDKVCLVEDTASGGESSGTKPIVMYDQSGVQEDSESSSGYKPKSTGDVASDDTVRDSNYTATSDPKLGMYEDNYFNCDNIISPPSSTPSADNADKKPYGSQDGSKTGYIIVEKENGDADVFIMDLSQVSKDPAPTTGTNGNGGSTENG